LGSDRLVERFASSTEDIAAPGTRGRVWLDTAQMASAFPVVGTGYGTFAAVYPLYRSPEVRYFYAHAHSDVIQAASEGGFVGVALLSLLLIPVLRTIVAGLAGNKGTLGVGFAAGLAAILLHALVDFNFHIPANAALAAVLGGALLGLPWKAGS
jgi:O-antigen ligase